MVGTIFHEKSANLNEVAFRVYAGFIGMMLSTLGGVSLWFRHGVLVETRGVCGDVACLKETEGSDKSEKMMSTESARELVAERHW